MNGVADYSSLNKPIKINLNICMHIFFIFYISYFFILLFFWVGPNLAHMGWARPSQPGPVIGPSQ
jgi:hypothetical protein